MPESREVKIIMDGGLAESRRASVREAEQAIPLKGTSDARMQFCVLFFLEGLPGLQHAYLGRTNSSPVQTRLSFCGSIKSDCSNQRSHLARK